MAFDRVPGYNPDNPVGQRMSPTAVAEIKVFTEFATKPRILQWTGAEWPTRSTDTIPTIFTGGTGATDAPAEGIQGDLWFPAVGSPQIYDSGDWIPAMVVSATSKYDESGDSDYRLQDRVNFEGGTYRCIVDHTSDSPTDAPTHWVLDDYTSTTGRAVLTGDPAAGRAALSAVDDFDYRLDDSRPPTAGSVTLATLHTSIATQVGNLGSPYFVTGSGYAINADSATDGANKTTMYGVKHYTNAEEPVMGLRVQCQSSGNGSYVMIGGGTALYNAATNVSIWTGSTTTTTFGTKWFEIAASGTTYLYGDNNYVGIGTDTSTKQLLVRAAAGQNRYLGFSTGTTQRWLIGCTSAAESGSDAGSNFTIQSCTDAGSAKTTVISIDRASGDITLAGRLLTAASTTSNAGLVLPHGTAPTSPTNGAVWTTTTDTFVRLNGTTYSLVKANSSNEVGIGAASASGYALMVDRPIQMVSSSAVGYETKTYANGGQNIFYRADGTSGSPAALASGVAIGLLSFRGHDGSSFSGTAAGVYGLSSQAWTGTAHGTQIQIFTTANDTTSARAVANFNNAGQAQFPITGSGAGVLIGGDTQLYRSAADVITTPDSLVVQGKTTTAASTTSAAGLNVAHGTAPTSPADGDMWSTTAGLFIRVNGVTKTVTLT